MANQSSAARRATFCLVSGAKSPSRLARTAQRAAFFALLALLLSLPSPSPAAPPSPAIHSIYLSHDLRSATILSARRDSPDSFSTAARRDSVPVDVSYLYDGVRFDPFPRNPRTDPSFGTDGSEAVSTVLTFDWPTDVPPLDGPVRFFTGEPDGPLFCIGTADAFPAPGAPFILPSASGLSARRSRTAFQPATDHSSATESFEITLRNDTPSTVPVTVVEHLLRSPDWEIVSSSVRQTPDRDASLIRMETTLPPRSSKTISYTVRYAFPPSVNPATSDP